MLQHYRLLAPIGAGGMGVVWKALDTTLDREVAIKILPEALAADPDRLARFEREARLLASLNHPGIAAIYGLHAEGPLHYLAMELVHGPTLSEAIAQGLAPGRVIALGTAIAEAVAAAHRQHITHRDLKPDNIMIDADGRPKVLDFGLATPGTGLGPLEATRSALTHEGSVLGTLAYMSPEQAQGRLADSRSDVFSLGIILYEMATGQRPFAGDSSLAILSAILRDTPEPILARAPGIPGRLDQIVRRCLEKDPALRYRDGAELHGDLAGLLETLASSPGGTAPRPAPARRGKLAAAVLAAALAAGAGLLGYRHLAQARWVHNVALPQLQDRIDRTLRLEGREPWDAFMLARKIDALAPGDPLVARLRPKFTRYLDITTEPAGAEVRLTFYDDPDGEGIVLGRTPLAKAPAPAAFMRARITLAGAAPLEDLIPGPWMTGEDKLEYRFPAKGELPEGMVRVPAGTFDLYLPGLEHIKAVPTRAFAMDRCEVTNRAYKAFLDAGGYADPRYWRHPFLDKGRILTFREAMARFIDRTGRPGPATWEVGSYPEGRDAYPVSGLSWYEAAAYAEWRGLALPTVFHWNRVAFTPASARIVPMANLNGKGPVPVGSSRCMNRYGVYDLAGNVREWAWNGNGSGEERLILGGGWDDPEYAFSDNYAQPAFDRSPTNGFRCIKYLDPEPELARLQIPIERQVRNFKAERPVSDAVFAQYLRQFTYDRTPLEARIEEILTTPAYVRQKISFNAAYGGERMLAYLFLPPAPHPPLQTVVFFPGSGVIFQRSSANLEPGLLEFIPRTGRALLYPIFKGTFERGGDLHDDNPNTTAFYRDYLIMWAKDLARALDYAQTRPDLDMGRLAYFGYSWGGELGGIMPAVEPRIKANVLYVAGLTLQHALPEVDGINYISRVRQPTLMLNGEFDYFFPTETAQRPMFDLLGTPAAQKKRLVYPGGHSVPRVELIKETLEWLDRYLGPVN